MTGQTDHIPWICLPQGNATSALPLHTQKQCTARVLLGLLSLPLTTKGSWIHLWGRVAKPLISSLLPVPLTPDLSNKKKINRHRQTEEDYCCAEFQVIMISGFRIIMLTYTPTHIHTSWHSDKVTITSTPPYCIKSADNKHSKNKYKLLLLLINYSFWAP